MAGGGGEGLLRLPRRAHQQSCPLGIPSPCRRTLAPRPAQAQPEGSNVVDRHGQTGGPLAAQTPDIPSLAHSALPRQTPKVGAVCGNSARTVLCGGRPVIGVPTAIDCGAWVSDPKGLATGSGELFGQDINARS